MAQAGAGEWLPAGGAVAVVASLLAWHLKYMVAAMDKLRDETRSALTEQAEQVQQLVRVQLMLLLKLSEPGTLAYSEAEKELRRLDEKKERA